MTHFSVGSPRRGVTLAELLVVIVIMALIAGIAAQAFAPKSATKDEAGTALIVTKLMAARAEAVRTRRPVVVRIEDSSSTRSATALPDGRIDTEGAIRERVHLNGLTGSGIASAKDD